MEYVSLSFSRVGVIGPNGAGKSTLIKLLTVRFRSDRMTPLMTHFLQGETVAQEGTVYKHPALRVGYVSQHATHHIGTLFSLMLQWQVNYPLMFRTPFGKDAHRIHSVAFPRWSRSYVFTKACLLRSH